MGKEFDRLLTELAGHFDALVGEVERIIEQFAAHVDNAADLERLKRVRFMAEKGATLARTKLRDGED